MGSIEQPAKAKKQIHLNFFETACVCNHMSVGLWKAPNDNSRTKDRLAYYQWMAKLAEKGKITSIFFADIYGGHDTYNNDMAALFRAGSQVAHLDPVVMISAMAAVTDSVSFGVTGSTSYLTPYILARTWSTLDHVTDGRIAWNVVTSYSDSAAQAMGKEVAIPSEERYNAAHEYMDLVYSLWEKSWEDGAQVWDVENNTAYDPTKIHSINFDGKYHKMKGRHQTHPSPQRTPVLFQAGASKSGIKFAGKHAEALYCGSLVPSTTKAYVKSVRDEAAKNGRDPKSVKFFAGISPIIGRTLEEAQAKFEDYKKNIDIVGGLAKFSSYTNIDMSKYPLDEPFEFAGGKGDSIIQGIVNNFTAATKEKNKVWTPRMLGMEMAFGGLYPMPVGTASMVADVFEQWIEETDIDGFNMAYVSNPESYETCVELLVPELQRRGLMWTDYAAPSGTFRENLYREPGKSGLPEHHPGAKFKWNYKEPSGEESKEVKVEVPKKRNGKVNGRVNGSTAPRKKQRRS